MAADNTLESNALKDINEMEMGLPGDSDKVEIIVFIDTHSEGAKIYRIQHDDDINTIKSSRLACNSLGITTDSPSGNEVDTGDPNTLKEFLNCVAEQHPDLDNLNKMLIIWDHGWGWRGGNISQTTNWRIAAQDQNPKDYLTIPEISEAISTSNIPTFDIIGFDACLMGMLEVVYQFKDIAKYLIASEQVTPAEGWAYNEWIPNAFSKNVIYPLDIIKEVIDTYAAFYASIPTYANTELTIAGYDLRYAVLLRQKLDTIIDIIASNDDTNIRDNAPRAYGRDCYDLYNQGMTNYYEYVDLYRYIEGIKNLSWAPQKDTQEVLDAIDLLIAYKYTANTQLTGLSIMYPPSYGTQPYGYKNQTGYYFMMESLWDDRIVDNKDYQYKSCNSTLPE